MGYTDETITNKVQEVIEVDTANNGEQQTKEKEPEKEGKEEEEEAKKRKAITPRSGVWDDFSKVKIENGEDRAKCKYCENLLRCDKKQMVRHL